MFPSINSGERYVYDGSEFHEGIGGAIVDPTRAFGWVDDIMLVFDESGTLLERLLHGPQVDQVLASEDASGSVQWFLGDHLGTIRDVVDYDSGTDTTTVVNHLQYSSFGQITSQASSTCETRPVEKGDRHAGSCLRLVMATAEAASQSPFSTTRYAFTGREWDADADLYYYRARWYDPTAGRFISEDPIGFAAGDVNVSRYVGNTPALVEDPTGLWSRSSSGNAGGEPLPVFNKIGHGFPTTLPTPGSATVSIATRNKHTFVVVLNSAGQTTYYRAGPDTKNIWVASTGVFGTGDEPYYPDKTTFKVITTRPVGFENQFKATIKAVNAAGKPYNPLVCNCNTFSVKMLKAAGIMPPASPYPDDSTEGPPPGWSSAIDGE